MPDNIDELVYIPNQPCGLCAAITFWQVSRVLHNLYDVLRNQLMIMFTVNNFFDTDIYQQQFWNVIYKLWNVNMFEQLPTGANLKPINPPIKSLLLFGQSEYGCMSMFLRMLFCLQHDIWVQNIIEDTTAELSLDNIRDKENQFKNILAKHNYNGLIPWVTYDVWVGDNDAHVYIIVEDGNDYISLNSNLKPHYVDEFLPIYFYDN